MAGYDPIALAMGVAIWIWLLSWIVGAPLALALAAMKGGALAEASTPPDAPKG